MAEQQPRSVQQPRRPWRTGKRTSAVGLGAPTIDKVYLYRKTRPGDTNLTVEIKPGDNQLDVEVFSQQGSLPAFQGRRRIVSGGSQTGAPGARAPRNRRCPVRIKYFARFGCLIRIRQ